MKRLSGCAIASALVFVGGAEDTLVACNTSERDVFSVRIWPFSSGNVVRGNYVSDGAWGIGLYGIGIPEQMFLPMASGNLVRISM